MSTNECVYNKYFIKHVLSWEAVWYGYNQVKYNNIYLIVCVCTRQAHVELNHMNQHVTLQSEISNYFCVIVVVGCNNYTLDRLNPLHNIPYM